MRMNEIKVVNPRAMRIAKTQFPFKENTILKTINCGMIVLRNSFNLKERCVESVTILSVTVNRSSLFNS
jgi:hypothetical protein